MDLKQFENITPGDWNINEGQTYRNYGDKKLVFQIERREKGDLDCGTIIANTFTGNAADAQAIAALPQLVAYAKKLQAENEAMKKVFEQLNEAANYRDAALLNASTKK